VAIRSSASQEVRRLVADLTAPDAVGTTRHDAALARLAVIGTRAIRQILDALSASERADGRVSLLQALETTPDPRCVEPVLALLAATEPPEVRLAAARTARGLLSLPQGAAVLDRLTAIVLDRTEPAPLRASALEGLAALPPRTVKPVLERLRDDPDDEIRAALRRQGAVVDDPVAELNEAADGWLPRDPASVLQLVARAGGQAPLSTLHRLVEQVRTKETEGKRPRRRDWRAVRGALHLALARRGSRVALYDLREALEQAGEPLPGDYLEALKLVGDAATLELLANAYMHASGMADAEAWRRALAETFRAVSAANGITRRHGVMKKIASRFGPRVVELTGVSTTSRTAPR
jgi:HEAT repeat protein